MSSALWLLLMILSVGGLIYAAAQVVSRWSQLVRLGRLMYRRALDGAARRIGRGIGVTPPPITVIQARAWYSRWPLLRGLAYMAVQGALLTSYLGRGGRHGSA
jgi:hypothetical protein